MAAVTVDATARNSYYSAGNIGWSARSAFAYRTAIQQLFSTTATTTQLIGSNSSNEAAAQSFTPASAIDVIEIRVPINKQSAPTDDLSLQIWGDTGANLPNSGDVKATADNVYNGANLSTTYSWVAFQFATPVSLSASTKYWFVLQRSGSLDATNNFVVRTDGGSRYASGGKSVRSSGTWGAESSTNDLTFQILTVTPSALYQVTQDTGASPKLHMWKSTDAGANWSEVDSANAPSVTDGAYPFDACDARVGPYIGVAYFTGTNTIRGRAFDMSADTWGTEWNSGDATSTASNERTIRVVLDNAFVTASFGAQTIYYSNSTDDADIVSRRRSTSVWAAEVAALNVSSTEASLLADVVLDKTALGFAHRFYYDCVNDDFSMRSLVQITQGTETDLDATAAADETKHASACYQIYQASGVDKIVAAYIDSDDTIQERTAQLEVTSASVTLGTQHQVSSDTNTAGRQLATCSYGGDLYVVVSKSGTAIDYYVDSGAAGSWGSANNWKTGLTSSSISNILSIEGYGLAVSYTDNGDVKWDWIDAPVSDVTVNGSVATATSAANAGSLAVDLAGAVAAADGAAYAGTLHTGYHVNGALATADGAALAGNLAIDINGSLATGMALANVGSLAIDINGGNATATGGANASTVAVGLNGSLATGSALANAGSLAIDIAGLTATASAAANAGSITAGFTLNGSLATATAQANDGTVQIDLGEADTHFHFFRLIPARDAT